MYTQKRRLEAAAQYVPDTPTSTISSNHYLPPIAVSNSTTSQSVSTGITDIRGAELTQVEDIGDLLVKSKKLSVITLPVSPQDEKAKEALGDDTDLSDSDMVVVSRLHREIPAVDSPLQDPFVKRPIEKDFVHLEDIPSNHQQSASMNSKSSTAPPKTHNEVLYPSFMSKAAAIADTLEVHTTAEKNKQVKGCFREMWDSIKTFFTPTDNEMRDAYEETDDSMLLFWHKGQKTATNVPKSNVDYVVASINAVHVKPEVRRHSDQKMSMMNYDYED